MAVRFQQKASLLGKLKPAPSGRFCSDQNIIFKRETFEILLFFRAEKIRLWFYIRQVGRQQSSTEQFLFLQSALQSRKHGRAACQSPSPGLQTELTLKLHSRP